MDTKEASDKLEWLFYTLGPLTDEKVWQDCYNAYLVLMDAINGKPADAPR